MAGNNPLNGSAEELQRMLMAKQGEVSNLRAKLTDRENEIFRLQSTNLDLTKNSRGGGSNHSSQNSQRRDGEAEKQLAQLRSSLQFKENELNEANSKNRQFDKVMSQKDSEMKQLQEAKLKIEQEFKSMKQAQKSFALAESDKRNKQAAAGEEARRSVSTQVDVRDEPGHHRDPGPSQSSVRSSKGTVPDDDKRDTQAVTGVKRSDSDLVLNRGRSKRLKVIQAFFPREHEHSIARILTEQNAGGALYDALSGFIGGTLGDDGLLKQIEVAITGARGVCSSTLSSFRTLLSLLHVSQPCRRQIIDDAKAGLGEGDDSAAGSTVRVRARSTGEVSADADGGEEEERVLRGSAARESVIGTLVLHVEGEWEGGWEAWEVKRLALEALLVLVGEAKEQELLLFGQLVAGGGLSRAMNPPPRAGASKEPDAQSKAWGAGIETTALELLAVLCQSLGLLRLCNRKPMGNGAPALAVALRFLDRQHGWAEEDGSHRGLHVDGGDGGGARRRLEGGIRLFGVVIARHKQGLDLLTEWVEEVQGADGEERPLAFALAVLLAEVVVEETDRLMREHAVRGADAPARGEAGGGGVDVRALREALPLLGFINAYQSVVRVLGTAWAPLMAALKFLAAEKVGPAVDDLQAIAAGLGDALLLEVPWFEGQASQFMTQGSVS